jgi:hypothetical protein
MAKFTLNKFWKKLGTKNVPLCPVAIKRGAKVRFFRPNQHIIFLF